MQFAGCGLCMYRRREITIQGFYVDEEENQYIDSIKGSKYEGEALGKELALRMKG